MVLFYDKFDNIAKIEWLKNQVNYNNYNNNATVHILYFNSISTYSTLSPQESREMGRTVIIVPTLSAGKLRF